MSSESLSSLQITVSLIKRNFPWALNSAISTLAWITIAAVAFAVTSCMTGCVPTDSSSPAHLGDEKYSVEMPYSIPADSSAGTISPPQLAEARTGDVRPVSVRLLDVAADHKAVTPALSANTITAETVATEATVAETETSDAWKIPDDAPAPALLTKATLELISQNDDPLKSEVELIPTPKGEPESETAIREAKMARALEIEKKASQQQSKTPQPAMTQPEMTQPAMTGNAMPANPTPALAESKDIDQSASSDNDLLASNEPETYKTWDAPTLTLVLTGNQHGYIEPCGCTGLTRQKGGVARRYSFLDTIKDKGWPIVPMDVGNQVRRFGRQATIKLQQSVRALTEMDYQAVGFGPEDIRLGVGDLLAVAASDSPEDALYVSANVVLFDPEMLPQVKVVQSNGIKVGVTSILDPEKLTVDPGDEVIVSDMVPAARAAIKALAQKSPDFKVLMFYGQEEAAENLVRQVAGFDLVVVAGGYGEPTYQPAAINGSETKMILTGAKGMYAGLIGLYANPNANPDNNAAASKPTMKYARVALSHEFEDAAPMRGLMKDYQDQLKSVGLEGLGLLPPIPHSSGNKFVGTATCGKCHTEALVSLARQPARICNRQHRGTARRSRRCAAAL